MALQSKSGVGTLDLMIEEAAGPRRYDANTEGSIDLLVDENVVFITDHADTDKYITLPPVTAAEGKFYYFYKTDASTQSVFVVPHGFVSSTLNGGDSANWDGSTGYDIDAQYDHLLLLALGGVWITVSNGIA